MQALDAGAKAVSEICQQIDEWAAKVGKPKRTDLTPADTTFDEEIGKSSLAEEIKELYLKNLGSINTFHLIGDCKSRYIKCALEMGKELKRIALRCHMPLEDIQVW